MKDVDCNKLVYFGRLDWHKIRLRGLWVALFFGWKHRLTLNRDIVHHRWIFFSLTRWD